MGNFDARELHLMGNEATWILCNLDRSLNPAFLRVFDNFLAHYIQNPFDKANTLAPIS